MKVLVLVQNPNNIPKHIRNNVFTLAPVGYLPVLEMLNTVQDNGKPAYIYLSEGFPYSTLLKFVEDYRGDLVVYTPQVCDSVFLSRFTKSTNRRVFKKEELNLHSEAESKLTAIKALL